MPAPDLRSAGADSFAAVVALLDRCGLPSADLTPAHLDHFVLAWQDGAAVGVAGIEPVAANGLLRSVAVLPTHRRAGLAAALVAACEALARRQGLDSLFLIAKDLAAARYFSRHGYAEVLREAVPPALRTLPEFSHLCPQSSPCLGKPLRADSH